MLKLFNWGGYNSLVGAVVTLLVMFSGTKMRNLMKNSERGVKNLMKYVGNMSLLINKKLVECFVRY